MDTLFYPLYMQNPSPSFFETKRHIENMWTLTPRIEGLTEAESISVYAGDFDAILDQIRAIPSDAERDDVILEMYQNACAVTKRLSDAGIIHYEDYRNAKKGRRYFTSCSAVCRYTDAILSLYQGSDV